MFLTNLAAAERKVYSQNGEDGVIEAIFAAIGLTNRYFVEFGVEDATECNTAYLLQQGWTGLMMDGGGVSHNPLATVQREHITAENINELRIVLVLKRLNDVLPFVKLDGAFPLFFQVTYAIKSFLACIIGRTVELEPPGSWEPIL